MWIKTLKILITVKHKIRHFAEFFELKKDRKVNNLNERVEQCFTKTGSGQNFFRTQNVCKYDSWYHFIGQFLSKMVRRLILWSAEIFFGFYGPRLEKVWETLL